MSRKSFAVIGLGKFGHAVAVTLAHLNCEVMVVDIDEDKIADIADRVTYAMRADITEQGVLQKLGITNVDVVVIAIADNLEASIMSTIFAKEVGVPFVLVKAMSELHARILKKIGADKIVFPEAEMGARVARNLISGGFMDFFELSPKFSMVEMAIPYEWVGKSLIELNLRDKYGVNVVGVKEDDEVRVNIDPQIPLKDGWSMILVGENEGLEGIYI